MFNLFDFWFLVFNDVEDLFFLLVRDEEINFVLEKFKNLKVKNIIKI